MLIVGAKGHAKEILEIASVQYPGVELVFFDNVSTDLPDTLFNSFTILKSDEEASKHFVYDPRFILGLGNPKYRRKLFELMVNLGGAPVSAVASSAIIGNHEVCLNDGLNIMEQVLISNSVSIGTGTLVNAGAFLHHDVKVGQFCEISPRATLTGGVTVGDNVNIGTGAILLPKVKVMDNAIIGAGAVVTKDVMAGKTVLGIPARELKAK